MAELFLHLSYISTTVSFLMRDMLYLRLLSVLASLLFIFYFFTLSESGAIFWEVIFIGINVVQIAILLHERRHLTFTEEEQEIYQTVFPHLLPGQYKKLLNIGVFAEAQKGEVLIEQGSQVPYVILIYKGIASIIRDNKVINYCGPGNFLGEISFISEKPATATVKADQPMKYVVWLQGNLRQLLQKDPEMTTNMQTAFNKDFIQKLIKPTHIERNEAVSI